MRTNPFESQLERLARTLTEQFGVNVICQGDQAWTDGRQIVLPSLPEPMAEPLERMMVGYLDHEMAHVAFSDFSVVKVFLDRYPGCEALLNVVEDALIERRAMKRWPGVRTNLDTMFEQVRNRVKALIAQRGPFDRFCTAIYLKLAHHGDMIGLEPEVAGYEDLLDQFAGVRDTKDAATLAEHLLHRWLSKNPPQAQQPQSGQSEQQQEGADGDRSSGQDGKQSDPSQRDLDESGQATDERQSDAAQPDSDPNCDQEEDQPSASNSPGSEHESELPDEADAPTGPDSTETEPCDGEQSASGQSTGGAGDSDATEGGERSIQNAAGQGGRTLIGEALAEAIAEQVAQMDASREYRVFTKQHDRIDVLPVADEREVKALLATGVDTVRRLRRGLANALRSAEKRWWRGDQTHGQLSPRTLHRLCMDRPRLDVFRVRSMVQGRSTAVGIVLDASGSMTTRKMAVARDAMRVLLEAMADLKIATEAFTFTTGREFAFDNACQQTGQDPQTLRERFSRFSNLEIGLIKQFEESVKAGLRRLPNIRGTGLTPLGEAMHIGATRLLPRPESRKIMLVLTDGKPGCEGSADASRMHAQHVAERIEKTGIELVGVGIMDDSLCAIIADTIVVHELNDLPVHLCKLLGRTLQKGLRYVG